MLVPSPHFTCASCASAIEPADPRVRCLVCTVACDMCATCVLGERFTEPHLGTHAVQVLKQSGAPGGSDPGADGTVPAVLGTTAICYYPPPPVPTLPEAAVGEEHASDDALERSVAQLSLGPESESVGAGNIVGPAQDPNHVGDIVPPSAQTPVVQENQHQLDGQGQDPDGHILVSTATQLPVGQQQQQQQDVFTAFVAQNQAAPVQQPETAPSHAFSQQVDQPPAVVAAPSIYDHASLASSLPVDSSHQVNQLPIVGAVPPTYQHSSPATYPPAAYPQQVDQPPIAAAGGATYPHALPGTSAPVGSFQQVDQPPTVVAAPSAYQHTSPVASPPVGYPQQVNQSPSVAAAPPIYHHAPPIAPLPADSSQQANQPPMVAAAPSAYQHASPAGSFQNVDQPPIVVAAPATYQYAPSAASPPAGSPLNRPNIMSNPPPVPPRRPASGRPTSYNSPNAAATSTLPQYQNAYHEPPSSAPTGWQPFFLADMSPSPTFVTLMNDVFTYLDPRNLGNLEPEVFSGFLDDLGYLPHENAWKTGLQPTYALSAASMADKSLKNAFDLFSIDHVLLKRIQPPHEDPTGITAQYKRMLGPAFNPSMLQNPGAQHSTMEGPMPAITRKGFVDIMALEAKGEPSREWGNWSRLLRTYNLPRYAGWGDIPRECFLEHPDPLTLRRVEEIRKISERQSQEQLAAARAYSQMAAQGRQNALDLIGDVRYVYR